VTISGGACQITTADKRVFCERKISPNELLRELTGMPNIMQITDASLPLVCGRTFANIIEDSMFAESAAALASPRASPQDFLTAFYDEGERHSRAFARWQKYFGNNATILPVHFSTLPMSAYVEQYCKSREFACCLQRFGLSAQTAMSISRTYVEFSFTGAWADMLRELGIIDKQTCYLVVEPFHHFTETNNPNGAVDSLIWRLNSAVDIFFRAHPYGKDGSANNGVQGAIAFMPSLAQDASLGYARLTNNQLPHYGNAYAVIDSRESLLQTDKVVDLWSDELFADGMNFLYFIPECRTALTNLAGLWFGIQNEAKKRGTDSKEAKALRKMARQDPTNVRLCQDNHAIIFEKLLEVLDKMFDEENKETKEQKAGAQSQTD
jgi:hypothetical protein